MRPELYVFDDINPLRLALATALAPLCPALERVKVAWPFFTDRSCPTRSLLSSQSAREKSSSSSPNSQPSSHKSHHPPQTWQPTSFAPAVTSSVSVEITSITSKSSTTRFQSNLSTSSSLRVRIYRLEMVPSRSRRA